MKFRKRESKRDEFKIQRNLLHRVFGVLLFADECVYSSGGRSAVDAEESVPQPCGSLLCDWDHEETEGGIFGRQEKSWSARDPFPVWNDGNSV